MSASGKRILIIGGGFAGMAAAIELRKRGADVELVEIDPNWRPYGAGITISGATLRTFRTIGILDDFLKHGVGSNGTDLFTLDGHLIAKLQVPPVAGPDAPSMGGILRASLAAILAERTRACGAKIRLGDTFAQIESLADGVDVVFASGDRARYDLVVGADGLNSKTREIVFPEAPKPRATGQGVWRAVLPRPAAVQYPMMWLGPKVKAGVNPISANQIYMFVTEDRPAADFVEPAQLLPRLKSLIAPFSAPVMREIQSTLGEDSQIVYRPLEAMLLPRPWSKNRVVLIGDAVHATTPHLASGAGIGFEDAIVLAEEIARHDDLSAGLKAYEARRYERCRLVVENSVRLGQIEIEGGDPAEHSKLMNESMRALAAPI